MPLTFDEIKLYVAIAFIPDDLAVMACSCGAKSHVPTLYDAFGSCCAKCGACWDVHDIIRSAKLHTEMRP